MLKTRVRVTSCLLWVLLTLLGFYSPNPASAETYTVNQGQRDFYFVSSEQVTMTVRSYAWQYGIDSMLWVYDEGNNLITTNDDYFGLDSYVSFGMQPNMTYRVRGGVCCGNPEAWYGTAYTIEPSMVPVNVVTTSTTTTESTTTLPPTTTVPETTTTTTIQPTTTTSTSTTSTTTTVVPTTTSTEPVVPTTQPVLTTTTTESAPTQVSTTTTSSSTTTSTVPVPPVTTTTTSSLPPQTTLVPSTSTSSLPTTITTLPPVEPNMEPEQALALATSVEALQELTPTQAEEVFDSVDVDELTDEQAEALVEAVQEAPEEVRAAFESEINIFGGKFDSYVPLGSTVNVKTRKVIVAASGVLFMAPTVSVSSSTSSSSASDNRKRR